MFSHYFVGHRSSLLKSMASTAIVCQWENTWN